jgi:hypothetical protein
MKRCRRRAGKQRAVTVLGHRLARRIGWLLLNGMPERIIRRELLGALKGGRMENQITKPEAAEAPLMVVQAPAVFSLTPRSLAEAMEYSRLISSSALCPAAFIGKPGDVLIAIQIGTELGVSPLQALQNIAVINGRATMWGDLVIGLVRASGLLEYIEETWDKDEQIATCVVKRKGDPEACVRTFSMEDAKRARQGSTTLAEKDTYRSYPGRMCGMRARSWALRDTFADVLKGLHIREEVEESDITPSKVISMPRSVVSISPETAMANADAATEKAMVDDFLTSSKGAKTAPAKSASAAASKGTVPASAPVSVKPMKAQKPTQEFIGRIVNVESRKGMTNGRKWTMFFISGEGGFKAVTFDGQMAIAAQDIRDDGVQAVIAFEVGEKGNKAVSVRAKSEADSQEIPEEDAGASDEGSEG